MYFARVHAEGTTEAAVSGSRKASTLTGDRRIAAASVGCSRVQQFTMVTTGKLEAPLRADVWWWSGARTEAAVRASRRAEL